jgi:CDP-diacylglycerol--serine O-phosphatidyltransferase
MYEWALSSMPQYGWQWGKLGWLGAFVYVACAALRLARFNTRASSTDKRYFQGLPSPAAAATLAGLVWVVFDYGVPGKRMAIFALVLTVSLGFLMVSNVSYYSFKELDFRNKVPFVALLVAVLVFVFASIDPPLVLFAVFSVYVLSGPVTYLLRLRRKRQVDKTDSRPSTPDLPD